MANRFRRRAPTIVGLVLALLCAWPATPAPAGGHGAPGRAPGTGFSARSGSPVALAGRIAPDGTGGQAQPGVPTYVQGWAELYNGCFFDSGSWQITAQPQHGSLSTRTTDLGFVDACGNPIPYNTLYYTWTDTATQAATDTFSAVWTTPDGRFTEPGTWTFARAAPFKQVCDCSCPCSGQPVILSTGELTESVTDYTTAGPNRLTFERYYRRGPSGDNPETLASMLGPNWRTNYDRYLRIVTVNGQPAVVSAERKDGNILSFGRSGGIWVGDSDVDVTLTQSGGTWTLTDSDDTVETYSTVGKTEALLMSIESRGGYTQTLNYNSHHQLISVVDSYGRNLGFTYQNGLLNTVTTPDGLVLTFGYTTLGSGNAAVQLLGSLSYSTNPATSVSYQYTDPNNPFSLNGIVDEDGNLYSSWTYDGSGRVASEQHAGGADLTTFTYNADGSTIKTNALGQPEIYKFATLQGAPKLVEIDRLATGTTAAASQQFTYDQNGYRASATDWNGNLTTYVNDSRGLPTIVTEAAGTPQQRVTKTTWDAIFHLPDETVAPLLTTDYSYDRSGNPLTKTLTDTTKGKSPYRTNGQTRTWTFTWANALPASVTDPLGNTTQFTYDASGALVATTDALGHVTQVTKHLPGGLPERIVDPNKVVTTRVYDARDRLLSSTVSTSAGPLTTSYAYDAAGNLIQTTLPDGSALADTYDAAHRLIGTADLLGNQIAYTLDALGDRRQTAWSNGGAVTRQRAAAFDALGRMLEDVGGAGQTTTYAYDANGNRVSITDPLARVTTQAFDALNRPVQVTDPAGGVTTTAYDPQDHPVRVTDPNGNATSYAYDGFGDVIGLDSPDTGEAVSYYDAAGNRVKRVDAAGAESDWIYDALNRVTAASYPADAAEDVAYTYDQGRFGIGRLTGVADQAGALTRSYDERGNILKETRVAGKTSLVTAYAYDAASRLAGIGYPSGAAVTYTRDQMGRITEIDAAPAGGSAMPVVSGIAWQPFGPDTALSFGNGIAETRRFDLDYRLTELSNAGNAPVQDLTYGYDADDNVLTIADGVNSGNSQSLGYDPLNRLTGAGGGYGTLAYTYDPVGNLLSFASNRGTETFSYAVHGNRLAAVTEAGNTLRQFSYTAAGNIDLDQQKKKSLSLAYDQANRLASVAVGTPVWSYVYDAFGQRLEKSRSGTPATVSRYQYDLDGRLIEERDEVAGETQPAIDYIYFGDRPVAMLTAGSFAFLQTERLGTPQLATDAEQNTVWQGLYQPYGQVKPSVTVVAQNLRLPGQYADAESGYYHNGMRDYDPTLGRYLESDPIGLGGGLNTYAYALGNPVKSIDPLGLSCPCAANDLACQLRNWLQQDWEQLKEALSPAEFDALYAALSKLANSQGLEQGAQQIDRFSLWNDVIEIAEETRQIVDLNQQAQAFDQKLNDLLSGQQPTPYTSSAPQGQTTPPPAGYSGGLQNTNGPQSFPLPGTY